MSFNYLTNEPLSSARSEYLSILLQNGFSGSCETVDVFSSCGRITSKAVYAAINAPHYAASAMDGIALQAELTFGANESNPVILTSDEYIVVDTGDPVPENCNCVVMIEEVIKLEDGKIKLIAPAVPWQHVRQIGEDICAMEMIIPSHTEITPSAIGSMLAGGVLKVDVIRKPRIAIIPTGDEIVPPTDNPKPGDIIEFNSSIFSSMVESWGCTPVPMPIVKDVFSQIKDALQASLDSCDIVLINAGSSAGRDDYTCEAASQVGNVLYHGIAIKPGKPAILGYSGSKPIIGVPGYPVSGIIVVEELLKPLIDLWYGRSSYTEEIKAQLSRPVVSGLKYEEFVRVRLGSVNGKVIATPLSRGAGVVSSFMKADGIMTVPRNSEGFVAGDEVSVSLLRPRQVIDNTVVVIGSHDPLIDELADMVHSRYPELYISSSHVGSMGGITASKKCENHMGGIHLLDGDTGEYNISFIKKYFPEGGVKLIECVGRVQGIMVAKGNPLGISSVSDLANGKVRYVNRQKGSGTRILFDYLIKKEGISEAQIKDYDRTEFTHSSVATQIASGSADAGMGIYSAAQIYGLDFIPICNEEYDLLIPDYAWDTEAVHKVLEVLRSKEFCDRLSEMGGYVIGAPGTEKDI